MNNCEDKLIFHWNVAPFWQLFVFYRRSTHLLFTYSNCVGVCVLYRFRPLTHGSDSPSGNSRLRGGSTSRSSSKTSLKRTLKDDIGILLFDNSPSSVCTPIMPRSSLSLSFSLFVLISVHTPVCPATHLPMYPSIHQSNHLFHPSLPNMAHSFFYSLILSYS